MKINTNIPALKVLKQLNKTDSAVAKALERLSSGKKINHSSDDASGLAISEKMQVQIDALSIAKRNANDGISLIQTAEGALNEVHSILQRARELSVQASNGTVSVEDAEAVQAEIDSLNAEIDRISKSIDYNGMTLLDGSINAKSYIAPESAKVAKIISLDDGVTNGKYNFYVDQAATKTTDIGKEVSSFGSDGCQYEGKLSINGQIINISKGEKPQEVFEKIRDAASVTGVKVTSTSPVFGDNAKMIFEHTIYGENEITIDGDKELLASLGLDELNFEDSDVYRDTWTSTTETSDASEIVYVNGVGINLESGDTLQDLANKLKEVEIPGAAFTYDETTNTITVDSISPLTIVADDITSTNPLIEGMKTNLIATEADKLVPPETSSLISGSKGRDVSAKFGTMDGSITGFDDISTAITEGFPEGTTVTTEGNIIKFTANDGFEMMIENNGETGDVELYILKAGELDIQIGANEGETMSIRIPNMSVEALRLENINVKTTELADKAITKYDEAIQRVSAVRSKLGAFQNRLEYTVNSIDSSSESLTASLSRIVDTDMAEEIANYTQLNVLSQASMSILAQANQRPEAILQLINK